MKIIEKLEQGSVEWLEIRLGKVTASRFKDVLAKGRGGAVSKTRQSYLYQLAAEQLTGIGQDVYSNANMEWGTEKEPLAREFYERTEGVEVKQVGFIVHSDSVGCSPDGLVNDNGLVEIKCPKSTTQIDRIEQGVFPSEYKAQVQGQLWVCEKEFCDFVSFDPRMPDKSKYFKIRVERDDNYIKELELEIEKFLFQKNELIYKLS